jgi:hypothetical protein
MGSVLVVAAPLSPSFKVEQSENLNAHFLLERAKLDGSAGSSTLKSHHIGPTLSNLEKYLRLPSE